MNIIKNPDRSDWLDLIKRPSQSLEDIEQSVWPVLEAVKYEGDKALRRLTKQFDGIAIENFAVSKAEFKAAEREISEELHQAIAVASSNIKKFHFSQLAPEPVIETTKGVSCWRQKRAIEKVGLYIPGGTAPLFSTVLMLAIPAQLAGCREIIICTPPDQNGKVHPAIIYAAETAGVTRIFKAGGAQAVAAMAYGTETIPAVFKIFGPGNQYVTAAKQIVSRQSVAIDMPAGPSEVLVIADETANPDYLAWDLLSQAEHGPDSQVILLTNSEDIANKTRENIEQIVQTLQRSRVTNESLKHSKILLFPDMGTAMDFSNLYAPEHLILAVNNPEELIEIVINAGSVFLGHYTPESAGDYASGTNHTLPTYGYARNYSGVSIDSFVKNITFQKLTKEGLRNIGPAIETMARTEELTAHENAVSVRLNDLGDD